MHYSNPYTHSEAPSRAAVTSVVLGAASPRPAVHPCRPVMSRPVLIPPAAERLKRRTLGWSITSWPLPNPRLQFCTSPEPPQVSNPQPMAASDGWGCSSHCFMMHCYTHLAYRERLTSRPVGEHVRQSDDCEVCRGAPSVVEEDPRTALLPTRASSSPFSQLLDDKHAPLLSTVATTTQTVGQTHQGRSLLPRANTPHAGDTADAIYKEP